MLTKYYIIEENYKTKTSKIVFKGNKYDCLNMIEVLSEEFIHTLQGDNKIEYYKPSSKQRVMGYFIQKDPFHLDKLIVKHKQFENGYFFSTPIVKDIISYYIVPYRKSIKPYDTYYFQNIIKYKQIFLFKKGNQELKEYVSNELFLMDNVLNELKESLGRIKKSD